MSVETKKLMGLYDALAAQNRIMILRLLTSRMGNLDKHQMFVTRQHRDADTMTYFSYLEAVRIVRKAKMQMVHS
jgi:hypothetical protein